jgi:hypothetical protein
MGGQSMIETWRPVVGFEGQYEVSDHGQVVSLRSGDRLVRKLHIDACGYLRVSFKVGDRTANRRVHSLVAEAFVGPRPDGMVVRHLDGNQLNNRPANLRYGTQAENAQDMLIHGTQRNARKTTCEPVGHPFNEKNTYVSASGIRQCRACRATRERARRAARKTERISA